MSVAVGTTAFMAPELLSAEIVRNNIHPRDYQAADVWALGAIIFQMLSGQSAANFFKSWRDRPEPFSPETRRLTMSKGLRFIGGVMRTDPELRMSAANGLRDPWVQSAFGHTEADPSQDEEYPESESGYFSAAENITSNPTAHASARWTAVSHTRATIISNQSTLDDLVTDLGLLETLAIRRPERNAESTSNGGTETAVRVPIDGPRGGLRPEQSLQRSTQTSNSTRTTLVTGERCENGASVVRFWHHKPIALPAVSSNRRATLSTIEEGFMDERDPLSDNESRTESLEPDYGSTQAIASRPENLPTPLMRSDSTQTTGFVASGSDRVRFLLNVAHSWSGKFITFSPDGKTVAVQRTASALELWDTYTEAHIRTLKVREGLKGEAMGISFSSNNQRVATCTAPGLVRSWDTRSPREAKLVPLATPRAGSEQCMRVARILPDLKHVIAISSQGQITKTNTTSGEVVQLSDLPRWSRTYVPLSISPDGKQLVLRSLRVTVGSRKLMSHFKIWNIFSRGSVILPTTSYLSDTPSVCFSPNSELLAVHVQQRNHRNYREGLIEIWNVASGELQRVFSYISTLSITRSPIVFSSDSKRLAVAQNGSVRLWHISDGRLLDTIKTSCRLAAMAMSPDGMLLAGIDARRDSASLWHIDAG